MTLKFYFMELLIQNNKYSINPFVMKMPPFDVLKIFFLHCLYEKKKQLRRRKDCFSIIVFVQLCNIAVYICGGI